MTRPGRDRPRHSLARWPAPLLAALTLCGVACKVDIQHNLDEGEANQILVTLERSGIPSSKEREEGRPPTWKIRVPAGEAARSWQVLREHELPRGRTKGFEVFGRGGLVPSQTEERALYQQALSGEIARMLQAYPGVVDARVLVSAAPTRALAGAVVGPRATASVLIKHVAAPDSPFKPSDVQALVAGAIPGLDAKDVVVVATAIRVVPSAASEMLSVGPFAVSSGSRTALQLSLALGLALIALLAGLVVFGAIALRRARARVRDADVSARRAAE